MNTVSVKFNIGDEVFITALALRGRVSAIFIGKNQTEYQIRYFHDSAPKDVYFLDYELELSTKDNAQGTPLLK